MRRREFVTLLVAATARLFDAFPQQSGKVPIIEFLG
jgi:hypothetical protein